MTVPVINPNLKQLCRSYNQGKRGVVLLGSSRSGKTVSVIDFLLWLCSKKIENKTIFIIRETYASFKTTLYDDFDWRLPMYGIPAPFGNVQERSTFKLFGNKVVLLGADNASKFMGAGCDFLWANEGMHIPKAIWDQLEMRCREFFVIDSNPEATEHYIYDSIITRPDVDFLKTTFLDNPFCPPNQRNKILSYEPWHPEDRAKPKEERRPHPTNIAQGTADEYMWTVFGLGEKAERKGRIFPNLYRCKEQPADATYVGDGMDYGGSPDPMAGVRVWHNVDAEGKECIYIKEMVFGNDLGASEIADMWLAAGYKNNDFPDPDDMVHDTNEPNTTAYLKKERGFRMWKAKKGQGSVIANIRTLKSYKIFILEDSKNCFSAFENYCWEWNQLTDQSTGQPMKKYKHFPDATAYVLVRAFGWKNTSVYDSE